MFDLASEFSVEHVALAERADVVVIAPATANMLAKLASGIADDMLSCTVLATKVPVILAPAMNAGMWENPITQENLKKLELRGFVIVQPTYGRLASGAVGKGRFAEIDEILGTIYHTLGEKSGDLARKKVLISAGGTQEPIDPIRYITNRSSGKMGYALAEAARNRGATVTLVSAPTAIAPPARVDVIHSNTAYEMRSAVLERVPETDVLIMVAAVADYHPKTIAQNKIKRKPEVLTLELVKNPDIVGEVQGNLIKVGFAAETENLLENAMLKIKQKRLDLIVANDITSPNSGFEVNTNKVTLISHNGEIEQFPLMLKSEVAHKILDKVAKLLFQKKKQHKCESL
jgi:phosphopantothenoylcysteine decarboxylase/phosphopantothenate--cysteine ligase